MYSICRLGDFYRSHPGTQDVICKSGGLKRFCDNYSKLYISDAHRMVACLQPDEQHLSEQRLADLLEARIHENVRKATEAVRASQRVQDGESSEEDDEEDEEEIADGDEEEETETEKQEIDGMRGSHTFAVCGEASAGPFLFCSRKTRRRKDEDGYERRRPKSVAQYLACLEGSDSSYKCGRLHRNTPSSPVHGFHWLRDTYSVAVLHPKLQPGRLRVELQLGLAGEMGGLIGVTCDPDWWGCAKCRSITCSCGEPAATFWGFDIGHTVHDFDSHLCHILIEDWGPARGHSCTELPRDTSPTEKLQNMMLEIDSMAGEISLRMSDGRRRIGFLRDPSCFHNGSDLRLFVAFSKSNGEGDLEFSEANVLKVACLSDAEHAQLATWDSGQPERDRAERIAAREQRILEMAALRAKMESDKILRFEDAKRQRHVFLPQQGLRLTRAGERIHVAVRDQTQIGDYCAAVGLYHVQAILLDGTPAKINDAKARHQLHSARNVLDESQSYWDTPDGFWRAMWSCSVEAGQLITDIRVVAFNCSEVRVFISTHPFGWFPCDGKPAFADGALQKSLQGSESWLYERRLYVSWQRFRWLIMCREFAGPEASAFARHFTEVTRRVPDTLRIICSFLGHLELESYTTQCCSAFGSNFACDSRVPPWLVRMG
eukprot:TRINITY_DN29516_c0_g1_i1.p1 TRINITY_DN29516_c0_g1~~TRINITY_DN29516_c0_g1_i1.p1  ORF type:complete len:690 (-),score=76.47 TRINITY_DN29516_c0_g1_i1:241-2217(-)